MNILYDVYPFISEWTFARHWGWGRINKDVMKVHIKIFVALGFYFSRANKLGYNH